MDKLKTDISDIFYNNTNKESFLKVCAPMVRYSKLQFRTLVKRYGVDLCFTPMTLADSFCRSSKARLSEFSTSTIDIPLIVQFAANTIHDFVGASELVYPYSDGVDLNCGCPQKWAMKSGYGCSLLSEPEIIHSLVRNLKNTLPTTFSVSVKIRLLKDLKDTIELCRGLENCGINFLTVHGRKSWQKSSDPVDVSSLKEIKQSLRIPVITNGNIKSLDDAIDMHKETKCDGVMAAQGMLTNPAMFTGDLLTPLSCVQDWLNICHTRRNSMNFHCFHHHLVFMLEKVLSKKQKRVFNYLCSHETVYNFLNETFGITPQTIERDVVGDDITCNYESIEYSVLKQKYSVNDQIIENPNPNEIVNQYNADLTPGKYFIENITEDCDLDYMGASIFNELP